MTTKDRPSNAFRKGPRISLLGVLMVILSACTPSATPPPTGSSGDGVTRGGNLVVVWNQEPDTFDVHVTNTLHAHILGMLVNDTLVWQDTADLKYKPGLAESWDVSPDGLSYTFKLRHGVKFHDNTPFNASAVKFSFDRIVDPATKSRQAAALLGPYAGTDVVDEFTARVRFRSPYPPFLNSASHAWLGIVSPTAVARLGADFGRSPVGTGSFIFKEWVAGDHATVVRNPDYNWAPPFFKHQGPAYLDSITFRFVPEAGPRIASLESGEAHYVDQVPDQDFARIKASGKYKTIVGDLPGTSRLIELTVDREPTNSLEVRQAMMYALDRAVVGKTAYFDLYEPGRAPLATNIPCYSKKFEGMYAFDKNKAAQLLDSAGWKLGQDGIRVKDGKQLVVTFANSPEGQAQLTAISSQWQAVGIKVEPRIMTVAARIEVGGRGDVNVGSFGTLGGDPVVLTALFHSKNIGALNWSRIKSSQLDKLLDDAAITVDPDKRCQLYEQAQQIIMDQAAAWPEFQFRRLIALQANVEGVRMDARGAHPWLYDAWINTRK